MIHKFAKPFKFEGVEYNEIDLNLEELTGRDLKTAKQAFQRAGGQAVIATTDFDYCMQIAVMATGKPIEFFEDLPANEYTKLGTAVQIFLMA